MNRVLIFLFLLVLLVANTGAVAIAPNDPSSTPQSKDSEDKGMFESFMESLSWALIIGASVFIFILVFFFMLIGLIYEKVQQFIRAEARKLHDVEFALFYSSQKLCKRNSRKNMRKPLWWTIWLYVKRSNIYIENEQGRTLLGKYDGHSWKKEGDGWLIVAVHSFMGLKNTQDEILIIPKQLADKIVYFDDVSGKKTSLVIRCEGIDETSSSDYFMIPLVKNEKNKFIDFSNKVQEEFIKKYIHAKVIKEQSESYRNSMRETAEMNPYIQVERKSGSRLKE